MVAFFICIGTLFLFLLGGEILIWDVIHFWECLFLPYWAPHLDCGWMAYIIVE